ncbi:MAG TPA: site-2 protease family protein [Longimicrobiales bacterium]|nr:site-2 protease family protein [Longimicrobiales bacterium]
MAGQEAVKPADPSPWIPLLADYRLTALPFDTLLQGTLHPGLTCASPEVREALAAWKHPAYLQMKDGVTHVALVWQARSEPRRWPWLHACLFLATLVTTLAAGAHMAGFDPFGTELLVLGRFAIPYPSGIDWPELALGAPFALPFLGVLLAHEMGHWVAARAHRVRASLPYFVPFPPYFSLIGTIGAFIQLRGPTVRRTALFDIGAAGPCASFLLSLPLLAVGLARSQVVPGPASLATPFAMRFWGDTVLLGNGVITHALASWLGPGPVGEVLILLHPLALVGWLGLFVTALNLLPLSQLDGGHVTYALSPRGHGVAARVFLVALLPLGFFWWGWWAWITLILLVSRGRLSHPSVVQPEPPIGVGRRLLGWALILTFFLTFVPVPLGL